MSEVAIYQPHPAAVPDRRDTDSWVVICSDVIKLANVIHDTEFVPDGLRGSAPAVAAAILAGREMGIGPMTSLQNIHMIKGRPTQSALLMRALVQSRGHKWEDVDVSDTRVVVRGCRAGESKWAEVTFTAVQAKTAGIDLGKYPQDKLYARASARLCRRKFADVVAGMPYTPDEVEDGEDAAEQAGTVTEVQAAENGAGPAKPAQRTAQRRRQVQADRPTSAASAAASEAATGRPDPAPAQTAPSAPTGLPPLPGEEEEPPGPTAAAHAAPAATGSTPDPGHSAAAAPAEPPAEPPFDPDQHGTSTRGKGGQLTALWTVLNEVYEFPGDDTGKRHARTTVEQIIGRDLDGDTTGDLSWNEAAAVIDTLQRCKLAAEKEGVTPREQLIVLLTAGDKPS